MLRGPATWRKTPLLHAEHAGVGRAGVGALQPALQPPDLVVDGVAVKALVVAGARPNFIKVAPLLEALRGAGHRGVLVHTGQHYDVTMSDSFFRDLRLPRPDHELGVGSGTRAQQIARVMERFEPVLLDVWPDWVVVVGDVNSTLACALVAAEHRAEIGCRIAHVEAGLRSGDWTMPEEVNRVLTDRIADLLLIPSIDAGQNLGAEGIEADRIVMVGNVMIDTLLEALPRARATDYPRRLSLERGGYAVATVHRPSNVDDRPSLEAVLCALADIAETMPVVLPMHPRTRKNVEDFRLVGRLGRLRTTEPLGYVEMLSLSDGAAVVLTDSGGLQEETTVLGVPCVTLRARTERPITLSEGTNRMTSWPLTRDGVLASFLAARGVGRIPTGTRCPDGWDGRASERVVRALESRT